MTKEELPIEVTVVSYCRETKEFDSRTVVIREVMESEDQDFDFRLLESDGTSPYGRFEWIDTRVDCFDEIITYELSMDQAKVLILQYVLKDIKESIVKILV